MESQHVLLCLASFAPCVSEIYPMLLDASVVHSLYEYITICLSVLLLRHMWDVSILELLWIKLLWTFLYKPFCEHVFHFSLGVEFPSQSVVYVWFLSETAKPFPKVDILFYISTSIAQELLTASSTFDVVSLLNFSHFNGCVVLVHCGLNLHFSDD